MRTIRIMAHVTLDGVIQHENREDFTYGNWTAPYLSPAGLEAVIEAQGSPFDLLLGRHTYDLWADYWPKADNSPIDMPFFSDTVPPYTLAFIRTQVTPTGVLINTYRPVGSLRL